MRLATLAEHVQRPALAGVNFELRQRRVVGSHEFNQAHTGVPVQRPDCVAPRDNPRVIVVEAFSDPAVTGGKQRARQHPLRCEARARAVQPD